MWHMLFVFVAETVIRKDLSLMYTPWRVLSSMTIFLSVCWNYGLFITVFYCLFFHIDLHICENLYFHIWLQELASPMHNVCKLKCSKELSSEILVHEFWSDRECSTKILQKFFKCMDCPQRPRNGATVFDIMIAHIFSTCHALTFAYQFVNWYKM